MQRRPDGSRWASAAAVAVAVAVAETATALLRPRTGILPGGRVAVEEHFSRAEVDRARRFGRPQLALSGLAAVVDASVLTWLVRRPPGLLARAGRRPLA
ncbi:MAG: hypothetical protein ACR2KV_15620, partial [Solirubrobacteraceae bacterium]